MHKKIRDWSLLLRDMLQLTSQMMALAWRTLPFCCLLLLALEQLQGGIPLASTEQAGMLDERAALPMPNPPH